MNHDKRLFQNISNTILIYEPSGNLLDCNEAALKRLGYSYEEFMKLKITDIIHPNFHFVMKKNSKRVLIGENVIMEAVHLSKNGKEINVIINECLIGYNFGYAILSIVHDLTKQKKEKSLKYTNEWFETIFEGSRDAVFISDLNSRFIAVNNGASQLTGYSKVELLKMKIKDLHEEIDLDPYNKNRKRILSGEEILDESKILRKDGRKVDTEFNSRKFFIFNKYYIHTVARDITKRREAENKLRESEKKFRTLTENINVGIYRSTVGKKGKFIELNPSFVSMFGYESKNELLFKNASDLYQNKKDRNKFNEKILRNELVKNEEFEFKRKDGTTFIGSDTAVAVKDGKGNVLFYDGILEDITNRKRTEEALQISHDKLESKVKERNKKLTQANLRLREISQLKNMFIASMSHEIRTSLNSIIGFTGIILKEIAGRITEEQRKQLTIVKNNANHILSLLNEMIDIGRIDAGKIELIIEKFDLSDLLKEVVDSFNIDIGKKNLNVLLDIPEKTIVTSDRKRIKEVFMNLISNAVKFTDKGEIEIKAVKKETKMEVSVWDTGIGIRNKHLKMLFKAFSQIPVQNKTFQKGTGLGLYLSKKIADLLGGEIIVESKFGKGSKFVFIFPTKYTETKYEKNSYSGR